MAAAVRRCAFCATPLPSNASARRKFCDDDCRRGRKKPELPKLGEIAAATEVAIAEAIKEKLLGPLDAGAVATLRFLAVKIDTEHELRERALEYAAEQGTKPPPVDNVSIPTYLNYCVALGLVPSGRKAAASDPGAGGGAGGGKLLALAAGVPKPKGA